MSGELKRFYKEAHVRQEGAVYRVALDQHLLRTPAKADLALPSAALAEALAEEWRAQEGRIDPRTMPLMTLISTALDHICLLYTSPSPRDATLSRMPSSA